jgi:glyoxylase-like metal-dependent hydrolase (beta-lactamase superfamily II)
MQPKIHVHTSAPDKFYVNSFLVEGDKSAVLIDTQFVLSEIASVIAKLKALEKPLAAIFITHPHPDHYNGLHAVLNDFPGTPVYATHATRQGIEATAEPKRAYWTPLVGSDYPQSFTYPDHLMNHGDHVTIDGIEFAISDFGAAECSDNTAVLIPQADAVIISDLVYNRVHPWLAESRSGAWLAAIEAAKTNIGHARHYYAGHGASGGIEILDAQAAYIRDMREQVSEALRSSPELTPEARQHIGAHMLERYAGFELAMLVEANADGIAAEFKAAA